MPTPNPNTEAMEKSGDRHKIIPISCKILIIKSSKHNLSNDSIIGEQWQDPYGTHLFGLWVEDLGAAPLPADAPTGLVASGDVGAAHVAQLRVDDF